jgi:hypothetical protein
MLKILAFLFLAAPAAAQTYYVDLLMDGHNYAGTFDYTRSTDIISDVDISGNGAHFFVDSAPLHDSQWSNSYVWFLGKDNETLGFQLVAPLGGAERTFTDVYLNVGGAQSWCDPGPSTCEMSLARAPEIDGSGAIGALTLLACCLICLGKSL